MSLGEKTGMHQLMHLLMLLEANSFAFPTLARLFYSTIHYPPPAHASRPSSPLGCALGGLQLLAPACCWEAFPFPAAPSYKHLFVPSRVHLLSVQPCNCMHMLFLLCETGDYRQGALLVGQGQPRRPPARGNCCRQPGGECGGGGRPPPPPCYCLHRRSHPRAYFSVLQAAVRMAAGISAGRVACWPSAARLEAGAAATAC